MKIIIETQDQIDEHKHGIKPFEPEIRSANLDHPRVLVVAKTRIEGSWAAYIGVTEWESHADDEELVLKHENKLREPVARLLFPEFEGMRYAG